MKQVIGDKGLSKQLRRNFCYYSSLNRRAHYCHISYKIPAPVNIQNSLDRKLSSSSSTENVFPGRSGPLTTQRSVADSLQSYSESDFVAGGGTRGNYYAGRKGSSVSAQEKSESATHFGAVPPPHRSSSCPGDQTTDYVAIEQQTTYYSPDSNYEQRQGKTKKGRSHARSGSKQALELSVINESIGTPNKRDSYVDISDETPLFWGSIDKKKKKKKGTKGTKKESAVVGAAAAGGTAAVGVAAHSAGLMASSAAGSCCCVGVVAKSVSVAMFVGVVVTVGYAGYNGVITALHQSVMTTVASTVGLEMTTFDPMTTAYTTFGCPLPVKPTLESLLNDIIAVHPN
ncbi:hypothetical protein CAPTEDRAFT_192151 [Capitella teleta]|uniref:Uncharacterized protein n=1 Tax=Capitella teleta TaxID=283909 RepID=R7VFH7_CAPTE|nr:hypothetical protein CAPTEDRAFT_192151 [Capitella teleta]|eukprot:ELU15056.1 hypothetical protein CAPTEDRAFT_192151 [Capitella teleta]